MWVHRRCEEPEPASVECYWKKPQLAKIDQNLFLKAKDLQRSNYGCEQKLKSSENFFKSLSEELCSKGFDSQLSRHIIPLSLKAELSLHQIMIRFVHLNSSTDVDSFLKFASEIATQDLCLRASKDTIDQSDCKLWKELRYGRITASKVYEIAHCKNQMEF